jgi:hypothetical protein
MSLSTYSSEFEDEALGELEDELEGEWEAEEEGGLGETEDESEWEEEISPIRKIYPDAAMEHLGALAAEAETEEEAAEQFLPLVGMAASKLLPVLAKAVAPAAKKAAPRIAKAVTKVTPQLTKGIGKIAKGLHRQPGTRPLLRAVPAIARRTVHSIASQVAHNRHITPRTVARTLATQTRRVLSSPRQRANAILHSRQLDRRLHHRLGRGVARPHAPVAHAVGGAAAAPHAAAAGTAPHAAAVTPAARAAAGQTATTRPASAPSTTRSGQVVGGQCTCPACTAAPAAHPAGAAAAPAAPAAPATAAPAAATTAPAYCRCCGQVLR